MSLVYDKFKAKMRVAMAAAEIRDKASRYQMYDYPDFTDRTNLILDGCSSTEQAIQRFLVEDPDGWVEGFLRVVAAECAMQQVFEDYGDEYHDAVNLCCYDEIEHAAMCIRRHKVELSPIQLIAACSEYSSRWAEVVAMNEAGLTAV